VIWTLGAHNLRFGGTLNRVQTNFVQLGWDGGFYSFGGLNAFLAGVPYLFIGRSRTRGTPIAISVKSTCPATSTTNGK